MPPKTKGNDKSAKTVQKEKAKTVEDKTFGLKNKKGGAQQKYIKEVTAQVMFSGSQKGGQRAQEQAKYADKEAQKKKAEGNALIASLFAQITTIQKTEDGQIDKKATLCPMFKSGMCEKGKKCKYSHDMTIEEQKHASIDLYADPRAKIGKQPDTIITCRDFLDAVERGVYGFNWECPNGGVNCQYRHMLPPGYVINKDKAQESSDDGEEKLTFEEGIEQERAALDATKLTPVTLDSFNAWKKRKAEKKQAELEAKIAAEEAKGKKDKSQMNFMSGKALFSYNPDLFVDDDAAADDDDFQESDEEPTAAAASSKKGKGAAAEEVKVDEKLYDAAGADEDVDFD